MEGVGVCEGCGTDPHVPSRRPSIAYRRGSVEIMREVVSTDVGAWLIFKPESSNVPSR